VPERWSLEQVQKKPRVLIVEENSFVPIDVRVWYEATTLRDAGWDVTVVCPLITNYQTDENELKVTAGVNDLEGVTVYRFPLTIAEHGISGYLREYITAFLSIARFLWRDFRKARFDVIHFCNPPDIFFPIAMIFRLLGVKVIFDHHDLFPELVKGRFHGLAGRAFYAIARIMEYLTFRSANVVIATNQSYRRIAVKRGGVREDRVVVVRNGPNLNKFKTVEPDPSLKQGFSFLACYAGAMGYDDGIMELISAIRFVVHDLDRHDIRFVLLGDGSMRPVAQAEIHARGLDKYVIMPGMITDNVLLRTYLSTADVLLSPEPLTPLNEVSTFIKIGEYMAMGKPIVAFDLAETRYSAQEAAIYIEPGNIQEYGRAIADLLNDPVQRREMGEIGRQRIVDSLRWEHQQHELLRAYDIALHENGQREVSGELL
jgi:glycosyltransferase involved in cell wall biosynthesis